MTVWEQKRTGSCDRSPVFTWSSFARVPENTAIISTIPKWRTKSIETIKTATTVQIWLRYADKKNWLIKVFPLLRLLNPEVSTWQQHTTHIFNQRVTWPPRDVRVTCQTGRYIILKRFFFFLMWGYDLCRLD